jgi:hypothetical protein
MIHKSATIVADDLFSPTAESQSNLAFDDINFYEAFLSKEFNFSDRSGVLGSSLFSVDDHYDTFVRHNFTLLPLTIPFLFLQTITFYRASITVSYIYDSICSFFYDWIMLVINIVISLFFF